MRVWKHTMMLAAAAIVAWPLASGCGYRCAW